MRIKSLQLRNIGVFENETIEFEACPTKGKAEIHIFTGKNGSGKSTILKALVAAFEAGGLNELNETICNNNTNSITKYFRSRYEKNGATICYDLRGETYCTTYIACSNGKDHLHIISKDHKDIEGYRSAMELNMLPTEPMMLFYSAYFAYSGYRLLSFSQDAIEHTARNANPLYQSLEFDKKPNPAFTIENWIKTSLLRRAYAMTEGLTNKEENYTDNISKMQNAISEIVGYEVTFKLDKSLREPVMWYNGVEHDLEVLPDGLKSIISWLGDLCMRLEELNWENDTPIFDRNILLFLDEIEIHLHIEWQRKILPIVQKLFPNAQIFLSTHSPFVVNSIDDAWVYSLAVENGNGKLSKKELSQDGNSVSAILRTIFGIPQKFGLAVENDLDKFYAYRDKALDLSITPQERSKMGQLAKKLAKQGAELENIVATELRQIERQTLRIEKA
jgi:predicted ATP-binding protein involved in virulence